jgi:lysophospholipase L1-like esterase
MSVLLSRLVRFGTLFKVLLVLALVDCWVRGPFQEEWIKPRYVTPFRLLRDRTGFQRLTIMRDALSSYANNLVDIAFVGDSTMTTAIGPDFGELPMLVGMRLGHQPGVPPSRIVQGGITGLYASDALLWINQLLAHGADVIVYGVTMRALPNRPNTDYAKPLRNEQSLADLSRLVRLGGMRWITETLSSAEIAHGLVESSWQTYAYRTDIRQYLWETELKPKVAADSVWARVFTPPPPGRVESGAPVFPHVPEWQRADFSMTNTNWDAMELIGRLCQRYAPGRCIVYAGPVNPLARDKLVEPDHYQQYLTQLRGIAERYGLIWRDYTDALTAADFRKPMFLGSRDPIHPNGSGNAKLATLLAPVVAQAARCAIDRAQCQSVRLVPHEF